MSYAIDEVARAVRRESARKNRVIGNLARLAFAMDAAQMAELSADELARHALKPLGLPIGNDPVMALDYYLAGLERHGTGHTRTGATDAADLPADNAIGKFLRDLEE